jgi:hypothetical protein
MIRRLVITECGLSLRGVRYDCVTENQEVGVIIIIIIIPVLCLYIFYY